MSYDIYTTVIVRVWGTEISKTVHGYSTKSETFLQEHNRDVDRAASSVRKALAAIYTPSVTEHDVKDLRSSWLANFQKVDAVRTILADEGQNKSTKLDLIRQVIG